MKERLIGLLIGIFYLILGITAFCFSLAKFSEIGFRESGFMLFLLYPVPIIIGILLFWLGIRNIMGINITAVGQYSTVSRFTGIVFTLLSIGLLIFMVINLFLEIGFSPKERTNEILFSPFTLLFIIPFLGIYAGRSIKDKKFTKLSIISIILLAILALLIVLSIWIIEIF